MRPSPFLLLALPLLAGLQKPLHPTRRSDGDYPPARLKELFEGKCASCHEAPDPAFEVDLAWISQLADTA